VIFIDVPKAWSKVCFNTTYAQPHLIMITCFFLMVVQHLVTFTHGVGEMRALVPHFHSAVAECATGFYLASQAQPVLIVIGM